MLKDDILFYLAYLNNKHSVCTYSEAIEAHFSTFKRRQLQRILQMFIILLSRPIRGSEVSLLEQNAKSASL